MSANIIAQILMVLEEQFGGCYIASRFAGIELLFDICYPSQLQKETNMNKLAIERMLIGYITKLLASFRKSCCPTACSRRDLRSTALL